jgi:sulfide dehydrogenase subunit beta
MFGILAKNQLAPGINRFIVKAPQIAKNANAGQFVILRLNEKGERIPLTIADFDAAAGTITIIVQEIGKTTAALSALNVNDAILDVVGPLGHPTEIRELGTVCVVAGGVGTAEIIPVAKGFKQADNKVIGIIGARNKELIILEEELKSWCDELIAVTDDGSYGKKGFVTDALSGLIARQVHIDAVYAIGPVPMMKAVAALTKKYNIKTIVSLNPVMVDGTGMCGVCRVSISGKTRFACVDGPEFDAHEVNWDELISRLNLFKSEEKASLDKYKCDNCKTNKN